MLCSRCSQPLAPRADRCLRCFALNPQNRSEAPAVPWVDSAPAAPVTASIASDPPVAPLAISFADEPVPEIEVEVDLSDEPVTEPDRPAAAASSDHRSLPPSENVISDHIHAAGPARRDAKGVRIAARLTAWMVDAAIVAALACANVYVAGRVCHVAYWLDFVRGAAPALGAMLAVLAMSYSWIFVALGGRTPGMAFAGLRIRTLHGDDPTPLEALARAALSLPSAAAGLFGFLLALFDARGQTLHDKLCRCVVRID